jgi:hypothetical protein
MNKESIIKKQQSKFTKQDIKDTLIFTLPIVVPLVLHKLDTKNKLNEENQKQPWERLLPSYMYPTDIAQTQYNKNLWEKTITFFNLIGHLKQIYFDATDMSFISNRHFQHKKKELRYIENNLLILQDQIELFDIELLDIELLDNDKIIQLKNTFKYTPAEIIKINKTIQNLNKNQKLKDQNKNNIPITKIDMHKKAIEESIALLKKTLEKEKYNLDIHNNKLRISKKNLELDTKQQTIRNKLNDFITETNQYLKCIKESKNNNNEESKNNNNEESKNNNNEEKNLIKHLTKLEKESALHNKKLIEGTLEEHLIMFRTDYNIAKREGKLAIECLTKEQIESVKEYLTQKEMESGKKHLNKKENNIEKPVKNIDNIIASVTIDDPIIQGLQQLLPQLKLPVSENLQKKPYRNYYDADDISMNRFIAELEINLIALLLSLDNNNNNNNNENVIKEIKKILKKKIQVLKEYKLHCLKDILFLLKITEKDQEDCKKRISLAWLNNNQLNQENI